MRTRRSNASQRPTHRGRLARFKGHRRRRLALAGIVGMALALVLALAALAADNAALQELGVTSAAPPSAPRSPGAVAPAHRGVRASVPAGARRRARLATTPGAPAGALVTLASAAGLLTVPRSFLGISTEYWALPVFERQLPVFERTLSLLSVPGEGPLLVRVGGDSADHSFWMPKPQVLPPWAFALTPEWLQNTRALVEDLNLRLILDLNLVTDSPRTAADWAQAAETQLPPGTIAGFEIGNEPDIYNRVFWLATVAHSKIVPPIGLSARTYARDFQAYARALRRAAPGVPLVGPALANPLRNRRWISTLLASRPAHVSEISVHRYPYSACALAGTWGYATIGRVLSEHATAGVARSVAPAVAIARRAGVPVRLTELNSVTCGGRAGVSDTFATALWAPDALFELLRAGVSGVNIHVRARAINAAFTINRYGLDAKPLLYGLIAFARMLGPGAQLVPLHVAARPSLHLKAWGVRVRGGALHVLLIDKGRQPVEVSLRLPGTGAATVQRLLGPSAGARRGITFGGGYLDVAGTWRGRAVAQTVAERAGAYAVSVPRYSAALVTLRLRGGALATATAPVRARRRLRHASRFERAPVVTERARRSSARRRAGRTGRH